MTTLRDWPHILRNIQPELASNIKTVHIFDSLAVFVTTYEDIVYGFGANNAGCVGVGHSNQVTQLQRIDKLCAKQVTSFAYNSHNANVLALTKTGRIFAWGCNRYGQLGNETTDDCSVPKLVEALQDIDIIAIRCGSFGHCLALSRDGEIFSWGNNSSGQTGCGSKDRIIVIPNQVFAIDDYKITAIECGFYHSLALSKDGVVYGFGNNEFGQLGIGRKKSTLIPIKINLNNVAISKIQCGHRHSLLLSTDGDIYAFGSNSYGQIGDGSQSNKWIPIKLIMQRKTLDIACINYSNLSMAKLDDGYCYVWGKCCDDRKYFTPRITKYEHINDVIVHFSNYNVSYDPIICEQTSVINTRFVNSFNDNKFSDIAFKIGNQLIHVQKHYLMSVCKHFEDMFNNNNNWSESSNKEIAITQHSYPVYHAFLKYLYTGFIEIKPEFLFELMDLAKRCSEEELTLKCVEMIKNSVKIDNVCTMCSFAIKYNLIELKQYCLNFVVQNFTKVKETDAYKQTDNSTFLKEINEILYKTK